MQSREFPLVTIIVLSYNSSHELYACLESIQNLNYPSNKMEVMLADNDSSDGSADLVRQKFQWVKVVQFERNFGYAQGNNHAASLANGEYIAFINPDTTVDKEWLIELVNGFGNDASVIACGGKVLFADNSGRVQVAGCKMCPHGGGYNIGYGDEDRPTYNTPKYTLTPAGCAMLVKKKEFLSIGGFDSDYFMYVEEFDFGYRLWLSGFKAMYIPKAFAYHKMGDGLRFKISSLSVQNESKNRLVTIVKDFEWQNVLKGLVISQGYAAYMAISFIRNTNFQLLKSLIVGQLQFVVELPKTLSKRKAIQHGRKLCDRDLHKLGLLASLSEAYRELKRTRRFRF